LRTDLLRITVVAALCVALIYLLLPIPPDLSDWHGCFVPAIKQVIRLNSPYSISCYYNPPWAALLLTPFTLLHNRAHDIAVVFVASAALGWYIHRQGWPLWGLLFLVFTTPVVSMLTFGNLEWLVVFGATLPPRWGLILLAIKPQASVGLIAYWTVRAWRRSRMLGIVHLFIPLTAVTALSFLVLGPFWTHGSHLPNTNWNSSAWPYSLPFGVLLLLGGIVTSQSTLALAASPLLSPYAVIYSFTPLVLALARFPKILAGVVVLQWMVILLLVYA